MPNTFGYPCFHWVFYYKTWFTFLFILISLFWMLGIFNGETWHEGSEEAKSTDCIFYFPLHFCFLSSSICCWLFLQHKESAAIESGGWWNWVLFGPIYEPTSEVGKEECKWHLVPPGLLILSLVPSPQPAWPAASCKALPFVVLLWSQPSSKGVFNLEWGRGYCVIALDHFDWCFFSPKHT